MVNKKKRLMETTMNDNHSSITTSDSNDMEMSANQNHLQSADSIEIEKKGDIKQEPVSVGEVVDVLASNYHNLQRVPGFNERETEYDFDHLDEIDAKVEVKKECDEKKGEPTTNADSKEEATGSQQNQQQPLPHSEGDFIVPESDASGRDTQKRGENAYVNQTKKHKCHICVYSTRWKGDLNKHMLKHTGEKPHGCDFCPKHFTSKRSLHAHMKAHIEEFLFHCPVCLQGFDGKNEKEAHEVNCKTRRYECHLCKESFGSMKTHMMEHMRVHSGDKPFQCNECFKQFAQKSHLKRHMNVHGGPRSFRCTRCRLGFVRQDERNAHEGKCNRRLYECYVCGKSFGFNKSNLIDHMRTHSGETPFECQRCLKQFNRKGNLNKHLASHTKKLPFKCLICHQGFTKNNKRIAHQRLCNRRCYECHLCKKLFQSYIGNLKRHINVHSDEKPLQCKLCHNAFSYKSSLKRHMKNIHHC